MYRSPFREKSRQTTAFKKAGSWKCGYHTGVDRVCDTDRTLVAVADGIVQRVNDCGTSYGYHLTYRTLDGIVVLCAHMAKSPALKAGQAIKAGQVIGVMGNTGNSSGAHLHIELQRGMAWAYNKNLLDPNAYINWNSIKSENKEGVKMVTWKNGSTPEPVYGTTADCKAKKNSIGSITPRETAACGGIVDNCYLLVYNIGNSKKCGFVQYAGGVK